MSDAFNSIGYKAYYWTRCPFSYTRRHALAGRRVSFANQAVGPARSTLPHIQASHAIHSCFHPVSADAVLFDTMTPTDRARRTIGAPNPARSIGRHLESVQDVGSVGMIAVLTARNPSGSLSLTTPVRVLFIFVFVSYHRRTVGAQTRDAVRTRDGNGAPGRRQGPRGGMRTLQGSRSSSVPAVFGSRIGPLSKP